MIMRKKQSKTKTKICPFLDENCSKGNCEIYNEILDRCEHCTRIKEFSKEIIKEFSMLNFLSNEI